MADVCVLTGGRSLERAVSLRSAARVERALRELGHRTTTIDVDRGLVARLAADRYDAAFLAVHGTGGEDGTLQELCELIGLRYTGSGVSASARCFDKVLLKHALRHLDVPTPEWASFSEASLNELGAADAIPAVVARLGLPLVAKPARMGSALGVRVAETGEGVRDALMTALSFDTKAVLERYLAGARDVAVSVLAVDGTVEPLPAVEAMPRGHLLYDFESRYTPGMTEFRVPAPLPDDLAAAVAETAVRACEGMHVRGAARVDVLVRGAEASVIDLATIPGMTETSLLPLAAEAAGIGFTDLVGRMLAPALAGSD